MFHLLLLAAVDIAALTCTSGSNLISQKSAAKNLKYCFGHSKSYTLELLDTSSMTIGRAVNSKVRSISSQARRQPQRDPENHSRGAISHPHSVGAETEYRDAEGGERKETWRWVSPNHRTRCLGSVVT